MRPQTVTVGPLAASSANNISTSQAAAGAGTHQITLNGTTSDFVTNTVCASQTPAGAGNLTINGTTAINGVAFLGAAKHVTINSAGNDSGVTYTVTGTGIEVGAGVGITSWSQSPVGLFAGATFGLTETITGSNASIVSTKNLFFSVTQVSISGAAGGAVTVGSQSVATLDVARQVGIASAGNDSGITFTLVGTDWAGMTITEVLAGANIGTATSVLSYKTITSIVSSGAVASTLTVGTTGVAYSPWVPFDPFSGMGPTSIQVKGTGTVNWTAQQSLDDPNSVTTQVLPQNMVWVNHQDPAMVGSAVIAGVQSNYAFPPMWARVLLNSGTGTVTVTYIQNFLRS
jgi:hypothetical protein